MAEISEHPSRNTAAAATIWKPSLLHLIKFISPSSCSFSTASLFTLYHNVWHVFTSLSSLKEEFMRELYLQIYRDGSPQFLNLARDKWAIWDSAWCLLCYNCYLLWCLTYHRWSIYTNYALFIRINVYFMKINIKNNKH